MRTKYSKEILDEINYMKKEGKSASVIGKKLHISELPTHAIGDGLGFKGQRSYQRRQLTLIFPIRSR